MAILPSELCRLVLGFLEDQNLSETYKSFLFECRYLEECRVFHDRGVPFIKTVHGKKLVEYVNKNYLNELKTVETQTDFPPPELNESILQPQSPAKTSHNNKRKNAQVKKRTSHLGLMNSSHVLIEGGNESPVVSNHGNSDAAANTDTNHLLLDSVDLDFDPKHLITDLFIENLCQQGFPDKLAQLINARAKTTTTTTTMSSPSMRTSLSNHQQHQLNVSSSMNIANSVENLATVANNDASSDRRSTHITATTSTSKETSEETTVNVATNFQEEIVVVVSSSSSSSSQQQQQHNLVQNDIQSSQTTKTTELPPTNNDNNLIDAMYDDLVSQDYIKWPDFLTNNDNISGIADIFCEEAASTFFNIVTSNGQEEEGPESPESEASYSHDYHQQQHHEAVIMNTPKKIGASSNRRPDPSDAINESETAATKKRPRSSDQSNENEQRNYHESPPPPPSTTKKSRNSAPSPQKSPEKVSRVAKLGEPVYSINKERTSFIIISKCARDKELALRQLGKSNEISEEMREINDKNDNNDSRMMESELIEPIVNNSSSTPNKKENENGEEKPLKKQRKKPNRKPTILQILEKQKSPPVTNNIDMMVQTPPPPPPPNDPDQVDPTTITTTGSQETTTTPKSTSKKKSSSKKSEISRKKHFADFSKSIFSENNLI